MNKIGGYALKKGTQMATKKFLNKEMDVNKKRKPGGEWDPYFEYRPDRKGRMKKVKKQIPDYIPVHDAEVLALVRKWAYRLDVKYSIMGFRFGWGAIVGLIPELGDAIDVLLAVYIYTQCKKVEGGLDKKTKAKMKAWIAIDGVVGLIPIIGDLVDASIKCNARNCRLLETHLDNKYKPRAMTEEDDRMTAEFQRHDPNYRPPAPATVYEEFSDDEYRNGHSPERHHEGVHTSSHDEPRRRDTERSTRSTAREEKNSRKRR